MVLALEHFLEGILHFQLNVASMKVHHFGHEKCFVKATLSVARDLTRNCGQLQENSITKVLHNTENESGRPCGAQDTKKGR